MCDNANTTGVTESECRFCANPVVRNRARAHLKIGGVRGRAMARMYLCSVPAVTRPTRGSHVSCVEGMNRAYSCAAW
jgi:hypothetical protein